MALGGRTAAHRLDSEVSYYMGDERSSPEMVDPARMDGSMAWIAKPSDLLAVSDDDGYYCAVQPPSTASVVPVT
jgi:hypothetical protein